MSSDPLFVEPGDRMSATWANSVVGSIRKIPLDIQRGKLRLGGGGTIIACPFGELVSEVNEGDDEATIKLRGGMVFVGDKNITIKNWDIQSESVRDVKLFMRIPVTVNKDDDNTILLPGIDTTTWAPTETNSIEEIGEESEYPVNTDPTLPSGDGEIIIPIGNLKIEIPEGATKPVAKFTPVSCGNKSVIHCAGFLTYQSGLQ